MLRIWVCWLICWLTCCSSIFNCSLSVAAIGRLNKQKEKVTFKMTAFKWSPHSNYSDKTFFVYFISRADLMWREHKSRPYRSLKCPWVEEATWCEGYEAPPHPPWLPHWYSAGVEEVQCMSSRLTQPSRQSIINGLFVYVHSHLS